MAPVAPVDQQGALGERVDLADLLHQADALHPLEPLAGQRHGHLVAALAQLAQRSERGVGKALADDPVVRAVAARQLLLDLGQRRIVGFDDEDDRSGVVHDARGHPDRIRAR